MASKVPEDHGITETNEGPIPLEKKRARRVSFAEITSIRVFDRDEEYETPPDPKPSSDEPDSNQSFSFFDEPCAEDSKESSLNGEEEEDDDEELDARRSFLRPMESPSPGSTFGSATSNDEDNFFGPVSASFIRPGRLSDSAASDDNHDITMDSTAFSMHFRSLARSDSGVDLKTPTGIHLSFGEKTPTQSTIPTYQGSSMVLAVAHKPISESSAPIGKSSRSTDSNDMSIIGEQPVRYDYARLSPELDALLAEGSKNLHTAPISIESTISTSPKNMKDRFSPKKRVGMMEPNDSTDREMGIVTTKDMPDGKFHCLSKNLDDANSGKNPSPVRQMTQMVLSDKQNAPTFDAPMHKSDWSPNQLSKDMLSIKSNISNDSEMKPNSNCIAVVSCTPQSDISPRLDVTLRVECQTPLAGSFSLLSGKQGKTILDGSTSLQNLQAATPSQGQPDFRSAEIRSCAESISSIQKSISRLRMLQASPFSSSLKLQYNSPLISSVHMFSTPQGIKVQDLKGADAKIKKLGALVPEGEVLSGFQGNGEQKHGVSVDGNHIETSVGTADGIYTIDSSNVAEVGNSPSHKSKGDLLMEHHNELLEVGDLRSQLIGSEKKRMCFLTSENSAKQMLVSAPTDSLLVEATQDQKEIGSPCKPVISPGKMMKKDSLPSEQQLGSLSKDDQPYDQDNIITNFGHESDPRGNIRIKDKLATVANRLDSLFMESAQSISPITDTNHSKEFSVLQATDNGVANPNSPQREFGFREAPPTHSICRAKDGSAVLDRNIFQQDLDEGHIRSASLDSTSGAFRKGDNESPSQKKIMELSNRSPSRKRLDGATNSVMSPSVFVEDAVSPKTSQLSNGVKISALKRKRKDVIPQSTDISDETARTKASPKLRRSEGSNTKIWPEEHNESIAQASTEGRGTILLHSADALSKISADMKEIKELISLSTEKLKLEEIDVLEDVLVTMRRFHAYEALCSEIQSQKSLEHQGTVQQKRAAEMKLLLQKCIHEQAKLQLMSVKRDRLLKKAQKLNSGIQESQALKLNSLPRLSERRAENNHLQSVKLRTIPEEQVVGEDVTALRQELEVFNRKIANITKSFQTSCKMTGEPSSGDIILKVSDHLTKRACCRSIRLGSQMWEVDKVESTEGSHIIILNYLGFVTQRITISTAAVSSITTSKKLNESYILKMFPNIDACSAFAFALNASTGEKNVGSSRNLAPNTQMTSSVLGNLLDVIEELQVARVELENLTHMRFCSPSACQLELLLTFFSFESGRKVILTLDISCLKCGTYPSEVTPSKIAGSADQSHKSLPDPFVAQVRSAVESLGVGYMRIIRLCRSISQVVEAWNG